ncbi:hypothetical protein [Aquipseudomonas campi]
MTVAAIKVCLHWASQPDGSLICTQFGWQETALIPPEVADNIDLMVSGGFSPEGFAVGFVGTLLLFAIGVSGGAVASILRRVR